MDLNRLTQKSQEAVQNAQTIALRHGHQEVDGEHLLLALLEQPEGLIARLLGRMDIPAGDLQGKVEEELTRRPKISGPGVEAGKIYVTQRFQKIFVKAEDEAKRLKFIGSPTIRINREDVEPETDQRTEYQGHCRMYLYQGQLFSWPPKQMIRDALKKHQ